VAVGEFRQRQISRYLSFVRRGCCASAWRLDVKVCRFALQHLPTREKVRAPARRLLASGPIMLNPFPNPVVINGYCRLQRRVRSGFSPLSVSC